MNRNIKDKDPQPPEGKPQRRLLAIRNIRFARRKWEVSREQVAVLKDLTEELELSVAAGHLKLIDSNWYVTHAGLLRVARRNHCSGIRVRPLGEFSDAASGRWVFKAIVYRSPRSRGFVGYGDADPSNVSSLVHGAEMRVAETRAVNRALRKAYGIGLCSVEELGWSPRPSGPDRSNQNAPSANGNNGHQNGQPRLRDHLCLLIRQAPARCRPREGLCRRLLRNADPARRQSRVRSSPSSTTWPNEPPGIAKPFSVKLNSYPNARRCANETPHPRSSSRNRSSDDMISKAFSWFASTEPSTAGIRRGPSSSCAWRPRTQRSTRPFHLRPALLHPEGPVEAQLVPPGLRLRPRSDGPRRSRRESSCWAARNCPNLPHRAERSLVSSTSMDLLQPPTGKTPHRWARRAARRSPMTFSYTQIASICAARGATATGISTAGGRRTPEHPCYSAVLREGPGSLLLRRGQHCGAVQGVGSLPGRAGGIFPGRRLGAHVSARSAAARKAGSRRPHSD